jgi:hypothetical protein
MEFYIPRKLIFKAWNKESRLLMRLDNISCVKGELSRKDHIILQYTGMTDKQLEELYEMDLVLIGSEKFVIQWYPPRNGWAYVPLNGTSPARELNTEAAQTMIRLCSFFESSQAGN